MNFIKNLIRKYFGSRKFVAMLTPILMTFFMSKMGFPEELANQITMAIIDLLQFVIPAYILGVAVEDAAAKLRNGKVIKLNKSE